MLLNLPHRSKCQRLTHWSRIGKEHICSRCPSSGTHSICSPFQGWCSLPWTLLLTSMWMSATCQCLAGDQEAFLACQHLGKIVSNLWLTTCDYTMIFPGWPTSQGCKCGGRGGVGNAQSRSLKLQRTRSECRERLNSLMTIDEDAMIDWNEVGYLVGRRRKQYKQWTGQENELFLHKHHDNWD